MNDQVGERLGKRMNDHVGERIGNGCIHIRLLVFVAFKTAENLLFSPLPVVVYSFDSS